MAEIECDQPRYIPQLPACTVVPSKDELESLAQSLNAASKVVIFGGKGCEKAHDEVMALAKKIKAAVGWAYRCQEALEHDNPYPIGMNGLLGDKSCLLAVHSCDLLLLRGDVKTLEVAENASQ